MNDKQYLIYLEEGNTDTLAFTRDFAKCIYSNLEIFQSCEFEEFYERNNRHITNTDRWEYIISDGLETKASLVFCVDEDVHVGKCMLVMCAYNPTNISLAKGYRKAISKAKELGLEWFVYSKQIKPTEHITVYKKIK